MAQDPTPLPDAPSKPSREFWADVWIRAKQLRAGKMRERIVGAVITACGTTLAAVPNNLALDLSTRAIAALIVIGAWWLYYFIPSLWAAPALIDRDRRQAALTAHTEQLAEVARKHEAQLKETRGFAHQLGLTSRDLAEKNEAMAAKLRGLEPIEATARRLRAHSVTYNGMTRTCADFLVALRRAHNFGFSDADAIAAFQQVLHCQARDSQMDALLSGWLARLLEERCIARSFPIQGNTYTMDNDGKSVAAWLHEHPL